MANPGCRFLLIFWSVVGFSTLADTACLTDVVFLIDSSGSMSGSRTYIKEFIDVVLSNVTVGTNGLQVGFVQSSNTGFANEFYLNTHTTRTNIVAAISGIVYHETGDGIDAGINNVRSAQFISSRGDRPLANNVLVVMTDTASITAINDAQADGIYVIVIHSSPVCTNYASDKCFSISSYSNLINYASNFIDEICRACISDVVFAVDHSGSMGLYQNTIETFLLQLVGNMSIGANNARIGYMSFGDNITHHFYLNTYGTTITALSALRAITPFSYSTDNIPLGIEAAVTNQFTASNGERTSARNFLMLFTDTYETGSDTKINEATAAGIHVTVILQSTCQSQYLASANQCFGNFHSDLETIISSVLGYVCQSIKAVNQMVLALARDSILVKVDMDLKVP